MGTKKTKQEEKKVEQIVIKIEKTETGVNISTNIQGLTPNEFRQAIVDVISSFTKEYENQNLFRRTKIQEND